ncbi:hypothetical protein [Dyella mobilis]|uniref:Uncharacterized protein n=1 Tax=Dyella mobilis TaxID=1849582 RepID=A0ABS2KJ15_9GAMM|nr:hypothetical protein [Dyella mobilis]MBM7131141.1 hypothetical protein [Dyella mobilis]
MPTYLPGLLGMTAGSPQVREAIDRLELHDIEEDPPSRRYIGSKKTGIDLLVEWERVIAVQIFVKAVQGFSAFPFEIPYGLHANVKQDELHRLLGNPAASDKFDSRYEDIEAGLKLIINFNELSEITYLNIALKAIPASG